MQRSNDSDTFSLVICCPDAVGIVAAVASFVAQHGGSLVESNHHTDVEQNWFFMRNVISVDSLDVDLAGFRTAFEPVATQWDMRWYVRDNRQQQQLVILASHASHCLEDLLHRYRSNELACTIPCVISNHDDLRSLVEWHNIPFHHVPVPKQDKAAAFAEVEDLVARYQAETIVLARYMQIIPPALCEQYAGKLINIHHSFLPSFVGANPYQRAYDRGVKLIGATAHYVTADLDQGPIIEQDVERVSHRDEVVSLREMGQDVERQVLARAVRWHLEDRVLVHGTKTIVFS